MTDSRRDAEHVGESLLGPVTRRQAVIGGAATAGFVTLGLKEALATSRVTGKPLFGTGCAQLNQLVPATPGPEYDRLLEEGMADPKGFLTKRFTFTKTQMAALDAATPAELEAIRGALRTAKRDHLRVHFDCGAGAAGNVLHTSERLHIASLATRQAPPAGSARAPVTAPPGQAVTTARNFQGTLNFSSPAIR